MPKRERLEKPVALRQVLEGVLGPGDWHALELRQKVRSAWEQTVPAELRKQARLADLRRRELWVEVSTSVWLQELQFLKPQILQGLERLLGPGIIRELRGKVASNWNENW